MSAQCFAKRRDMIKCNTKIVNKSSADLITFEPFIYVINSFNYSVANMCKNGEHQTWKLCLSVITTK